jgi:hypothetical protein
LRPVKRAYINAVVAKFIAKAKKSKAKAATRYASSHTMQIASTHYMLVLLLPQGFVCSGSPSQIGRTCGPCRAQATEAATLRPPRLLLPDAT